MKRKKSIWNVNGRSEDEWFDRARVRETSKMKKNIGGKPCTVPERMEKIAKIVGRRNWCPSPSNTVIRKRAASHRREFVPEAGTPGAPTHILFYVKKFANSWLVFSCIGTDFHRRALKRPLVISKQIGGRVADPV